MAAATPAEINATRLFFLSTGAAMSDAPHRNIGAEAHDGRHKKQENESSEYESEGEGALLAACHVFRTEWLFRHSRPHPITDA